ncbi:hypothetical protein CPB84DRAFT_1817259 [Gymnopilus junonius]|uniref:Uncharacterized protein n=1 Tax=Gymnopilus junonius TaxID=109634 RepID=A0A9P5TIE2_GYMJU|nr:hypothetical protein CPB84DRAFT_1817259 [Gymnopilus junonius]
MKPTKRQRIPGPSGSQLSRTVNALELLMEKLEPEQGYDVEKVPSGIETEFMQLNEVLQILQTKLDGPPSQNLSFEHLRKTEFSGPDFLELKPDAITRAIGTDSIGEDELWSSKGLFRHLCTLEELVPRTNEAANRLWIDAFFYRVSTMMPSGLKMVLYPERTVPGYVNFTAIATTPIQAMRLLRNPTLLKADDSALFVSEAKGPDQQLESHVPQAVGEMYASANRLGTTTIRGVLTNGHSWIFLILKLNSDGNGGRYSNQSHSHSSDFPSLISAIITHWMQHGYEELDDNDYFKFE